MQARNLHLFTRSVKGSRRNFVGLALGGTAAGAMCTQIRNPARHQSVTQFPQRFDRELRRVGRRVVYVLPPRIPLPFSRKLQAQIGQKIAA